MALLNKTSILGIKSNQTSRGRSGESKLLNQATFVTSRSPVGNPNSNKIAKTQTSRLTKSQAFTRGGILQTFRGQTVRGSSQPPPSPNAVDLLFARINLLTPAGTMENESQMQTFLRELNSINL